MTVAIHGNTENGDITEMRMGFLSQPVFTAARDARQAVDEIRREINQADIKAVLIFVTGGYDLDGLAEALRCFTVPVFGCTTAGTIGAGGYRSEGIQAVALGGDSLSVRIELIQPLRQCQSRVSELGKRIEEIPLRTGYRRFGLLLVDGLSHAEERLAAALHHCLAEMPLIGGSAGDDLQFKATRVFADGRFLGDAAVLAVFETDAPFATFKLQHFEPSEEILVVTEADAETRRVYEFNGQPAAQAYAEKLGLCVTQLEPEVFSHSPVMLKLGDENYVRSIQRCHDDLSLSFYCAIAKGMVMRLGRAVSPRASLEQALAEVKRKVPHPDLIIGCDCILRRLEFEQCGLVREIGQVLAENRVVGFSTYGEQFNALHMNQTFTGLAIGGKA